MSESLGMNKQEVRDKFWHVTGSVVQMKVADGHCIFYNEGCTVHKGRPWRCAQWPLHPSILSDENNFNTIRESCPGINQDISYNDFCRIFKELMDDSQIVQC